MFNEAQLASLGFAWGLRASCVKSALQTVFNPKSFEPHSVSWCFVCLNEVVWLVIALYRMRLSPYDDQITELIPKWRAPKSFRALRVCQRSKVSCGYKYQPQKWVGLCGVAINIVRWTQRRDQDYPRVSNSVIFPHHTTKLIC